MSSYLCILRRRNEDSAVSAQSCIPLRIRQTSENLSSISDLRIYSAVDEEREEGARHVLVEPDSDLFKVNLMDEKNRFLMDEMKSSYAITRFEAVHTTKDLEERSIYTCSYDIKKMGTIYENIVSFGYLFFCKQLLPKTYFVRHNQTFPLSSESWEHLFRPACSFNTTSTKTLADFRDVFINKWAIPSCVDAGIEEKMCKKRVGFYPIEAVHIGLIRLMGSFIYKMHDFCDGSGKRKNIKRMMDAHLSYRRLGEGFRSPCNLFSCSGNITFLSGALSCAGFMMLDVMSLVCNSDLKVIFKSKLRIMKIRRMCKDMKKSVKLDLEYAKKRFDETDINAKIVGFDEAMDLFVASLTFREKVFEMVRLFFLLRVGQRMCDTCLEDKWAKENVRLNIV